MLIYTLEMEEPPIKTFYCSECRTRHDDPGFCYQCPDEPLLDLMDPQVHEWLADMDRKRKFQHYYKIALALAASFAGLCVLFPPLGVTTLLILFSGANGSNSTEDFLIELLDELPLILSEATESLVILSAIKILAFIPLIKSWHLYQNPPKLLYPQLSGEDLEFLGKHIPLGLNTAVDDETQAMIDEINHSNEDSTYGIFWSN
ncbi:MAG: hypothetical protein CMH60_04735 [Myxococcales bacterium]|nr:hypothetical protein [Myxococcales bacterium]